MKRSALALALLGILALTGCAPDTGDAVTNCGKARAAVLDDSPGEQNSEDLDRLVESMVLCQEAADRDPAGFVEKWSDG